ncbi:PREDICTED: growth-regulating factor 1-like [Ipomoea nil]|uniref:growth-regulating factor 1-like n=1 Tax=Ipomoea nil TaxID=35883 RepID=UPI000900BB21|nr:PREDICTED: growth-regulating factor 1-like [Ipomoea nil]
MDFGLMAAAGTAGTTRQHPDEPPGGGDTHGSGHPKQERSAAAPSKVPSFLWRSADSVPGKATMLSFSSSKSEEIPFLSSAPAGEDSSKTICFPLFESHQKRGPHSGAASSAYAIGGLNESLRGGSARISGPFTPSQWMELEHQALIYKHMVANVPIPSNLLIPLMKSLNPYAFSGLSPGSYAPNWGWGAFHLGLSANTDPEPGRCRRTDGKKWRCSRDAVPDQKYCERHINRGRHRSRKPVEGQTGHAVSGSTTSKVSPIASSSASAASVISCDATSNTFGAMKHHFNNTKPSPANPSTHHLMNNRTQGHNPYKESSQELGFGFPSSDSVLNPLQRRPFVNSHNSDTLLDFNAHEQHLVHHFIDGWTKEQSTCAPASWPTELKSDWTQLSMSIPMASSDFSSSSTSPRQEKPTISPLRLSRELEPFQMGLGVSNNGIADPIQKPSTWIPVTWGNSMGGPLGEALNNTYGSAGAGKTSPNLNLTTEMWSSSPYMGSSPTGVLQKSSFVSLSNSSTASSPQDDNKKVESARMCNDMVGSSVVSSLSIPSL